MPTISSSPLHAWLCDCPLYQALCQGHSTKLSAGDRKPWGPVAAPPKPRLGCPRSIIREAQPASKKGNKLPVPGGVQEGVEVCFQRTTQHPMGQWVRLLSKSIPSLHPCQKHRAVVKDMGRGPELQQGSLLCDLGQAASVSVPQCPHL